MARTLSLYFILPLIGLALGACAPIEPQVSRAEQVSALTEKLVSLGPEVDPEEAARAARIAYEHTDALAIAYEITDPPLVHNMKVNAGIKTRGLCWHWADDMESRLKQENFQTLTLHRAIANSHTRILIDHSTAIIGRKGDSYLDGVVLDPWRKGGELTWVQTSSDDRYDWVAQEEVFRLRRERRARRTGQPA